MAEPTAILETSDAVSKMNEETEKIEGDTIVMKIREAKAPRGTGESPVKKKTPIEAARDALAQKRKATLSIDKPKPSKASPILDESILEAVVTKILSEKQRQKEMKRQEEARHKEAEIARLREEQEKQERKAKKYDDIKRKAIEEYEASRSRAVPNTASHVPPIAHPMDIRDKIRMLYK